MQRDRHRSSCMPGRCASPSAPTSAAPSPASGTARRRSCARARRHAWRRRASRRCFPLVPYSNRLGYRRFRWRGRDYATRANFEGSPHSLHGLGWQRPWRIVSSSALEVVLELRHDGDADWPFAFEARQYFTLDTASFSAPPAVHQRGAGEQPAGLGWHPYFVRRLRSRMHIELSDRWDADATQLPTRKVAQHGIDSDVVAPRLRQLLRGLARPGADPRREASRSSSRRRWPTSSSTRRPSATTSASSRSATSATRSTWPSRRPWPAQRSRRARRSTRGSSSTSRCSDGALAATRRAKRRVSPIASTVKSSSARPAWRAARRAPAAARRATRRSARTCPSARRSSAPREIEVDLHRLRGIDMLRLMNQRGS